MPATRFAHLRRREAVSVLAVTAVAMILCLVVAIVWREQIDPFHSVYPTARAADATEPTTRGNDLDLYKSIVRRVHGGQYYYDAAHAELTARGYPTGSTFNWRMPTYAYALGKLPNPAWGQYILIGLVLLTIALMYNLVAPEGGVWMGLLTVVLMAAANAWLFQADLFYVQEFWAGTLIAASVCAYGLKRWPIGLALGLAALFYRELALPYCVIAAVLAGRERRWWEVGIWVAGFALFAGLLAFHAMEVARRAGDAQRGNPLDWLAFGGLIFILKSCRSNYVFLLLPGVCTAIYLPLCILGLAGWRGPTAVRALATAGVYLLAFAVVGQPINYYWGIMIVPLLILGFVWSLVAIYDLWLALRGRGRSIPL